MMRDKHKKFEIERRYWEQKGINWGIVTDNEISKTLANNIWITRQLHNLEMIKGFEKFLKVQIDELIREFIKHISGELIVVRKVAKDFDKRFCLEAGTGIKIFKHLISHKEVAINMNNPMNLDSLTQVRIISKN